MGSHTQSLPRSTGRDPVLDMMRGVGIVLMVNGHSGSPVVRYIYLFHMALFFMLSGFLVRPAASEDTAHLGHFLLSKIKTLWLPFVVANTCFTVLNNLFLQLNILTTDPRIVQLPGNITHAPITLKDVVGRTLHWAVFDGGTQLGGALWFNQVLFQISVVYILLDFAFKKLLPRLPVLVAQGVTAAVLLAGGFAASRAGWNVQGLGIAASCYSLFYLGQLLRHLPRQFPKPALAVCCVASFGVLAFLSQFGWVSLVDNQYINPAFLLSTSLAGWALVYSGCSLLCAVAPVRAALCYLGRATMPVVALHFLAFKLVTWIGLAVTGGENYLLAVFPVYFTGGAWWLAYTVVGLLVPLIFRELFRKIASKIIKKGPKTA